MAVWVRDELFGHHQHADAHPVQDLFLGKMGRIRIYPFHEVPHLVHKRVIDRGGGHAGGECGGKQGMIR